MAILRVDDIPDDRYEALKARAAQNNRSIEEEILDLLYHRYPTPEETKQRFAQVDADYQYLLEHGVPPPHIKWVPEDPDR